MSERRVQVPAAMIEAAVDQWHKQLMDVDCVGDVRSIVEAALQWLVANPQVPTDEQIDSIEFEPCSTARWAKQCITEFQRRFLFAPAEPEDPLEDLLLRPKSDAFPGECGVIVNDKIHDANVREAFRRGQQSMIKKEKQP